MSQTMMQATLWILTLGALALFLQRRRRRKSDF